MHDRAQVGRVMATSPVDRGRMLCELEALAGPSCKTRLRAEPLPPSPRVLARWARRVAALTSPGAMAKPTTRKRDRPRCGARCRSRDGASCLARAVWDHDRNAPVNGRCRQHGGLSTGARTPEGRERLREAGRRGAYERWRRWREARQVPE